VAKVIHYEFANLDDWVKVMSSIDKDVKKFEDMYPGMIVTHDSILNGEAYIIELYIEYEGENDGIL
jgi:hypothetical protein